MGEYARYGATDIKIGTCENMYYLRADQRHKVIAKDGNTDPASVEDQKHIRFRFPWPDEDHIEPGAFEHYDRSICVRGVPIPAEVEHGNVQFHASAGYLVNLPCPEGMPRASDDSMRVTAPSGLVIHRNGFSGALHIVQQAFRGENLVTVCKCGGCGARWAYWTRAEVLPIVESLITQAEKEQSKFLAEVASRLLAGYAGNE